MTGPRGVAALLATALSLVALAPAPADAVALDLRRCAPERRADRSRCGHLTVPLDRSGAVPGRVALRVRALPPERRGGAGGTVLALAGGPGQAAAPLLEPIASALGAPLRTRRLVTFDQRGTGRSGRLRCPELGRIRRAAELDAAVGACAERLGPSRTAYTTAASVEDIEALRVALGEERIAIFAVSYGTKVALQYAARYPEHVSRLILDSVVAPGPSDPFMRTTIASIRRVLDTLCARRACRFTPDATRDLATLVQRIAAGRPPRAAWYDGNGRARPVTVTREDLFSLLLAGDFNGMLRAGTPAALRAAVQGDAAPLVRLLRGTGAVGLAEDSGDSDALFLATTCEDGGVPWPTGTPVDQRAAAVEAALAAVPEAALSPFDRATLRALEVDICRAWPEAPIEQPTPPLPDVPTLILSGDDDLRTPRREALALAQAMPSARVVRVPESGHSVLSSDLFGCAERQVARFFADRRTADCPFIGNRRLFVPDRLAPRTLAAVPPVRGVPTRVGRTLAGVDATFERLAFDLLFSVLSDGGRSDRYAFGGLRGGRVVVTDRLIVIDRYRYVPGLRIAARLGVGQEDLVLRVSGGAAAAGTVRFTSRGPVGRLGGQRFDLRVREREGDAARASATGAHGPLRHVSEQALRDAIARAQRLPEPLAARAPLPGLPGRG